MEEAVQSSKVHLLSTDHVSGVSNTWQLPFDPSLKEVTVSLSGPAPHIEIRNPQGNKGIPIHTWGKWAPFQADWTLIAVIYEWMMWVLCDGSGDPDVDVVMLFVPSHCVYCDRLLDHLQLNPGPTIINEA